MEKYYLGQLIGSPDLERGIKFVEVHYARKAPSLGLVYLSGIASNETSSDQVSAAASSAALTSSSNQLNLVALELDDNKEVHLSVVRKVQLPLIRETLDFDINSQLVLDGQQAQQDHLHCLILANSEVGFNLLFTVQLNGDSNKDTFRQLTGECAQQNSTTGQLMKCRIHHSLDYSTKNSSTNCCFLHLLAEKCYTLCRVNHSEATLEPLCRYLMPANERTHLRFVDLHVVNQANQELLLLKLSDSSLKIIHKGICVSTFNLNSKLTPSTDCSSSLPSYAQLHFQQQLILTPNTHSTDEALLIFSSGAKIDALNLLINLKEESSKKSSSNPSEDPDQLLLREPSFELEKCWTLDLYDLESIRALGDLNDQDIQVCLCPMWSGNQSSEGSWAKFLIVMHKFHLLVYTFQQQQPALPFSFIYDRAFLGLNEDETFHERGNLSYQQQQQYNEYIDVKVRPRLVYNFKLIGPQPTDALFNTLFLAPKAQLVKSKHFPQLGLLAALTNSGHLFAFKFTSERITGHKDSLYQQLLSDSIRGSSRLLLDQIETLQRNNKQLREDITNLESRASKSQQQQFSDNLDNLIRTSLKQRSDTIGFSYNLNISISNLINVARIIVISTASSCFLKPSSSSLHSIHIDNNASSSRDKAILLATDILHHNSLTEQHDSAETLNESRNSEYPVFAYAIVDINSGFRSISLSLPIYIIDGQQGLLKIFHILSDSSLLRENNFLAGKFPIQTEEQSEVCESVSRFHIQNLDILPLNSYQQQQPTVERITEVQLSTKITGSFQQVQVFSWLNEVFQLTTLNGTVKSSFTHCAIEYKIKDGSLEIFSDDMFALELIKKHILKRATNKSIVLNVIDSGICSVRNLRHLIGCQYTNVEYASNLLQNSVILADANGEVDKARSLNESLDLLFESLLSEISMSDLMLKGTQTPPDIDSIKNSMRKDIELLSVNEYDHNVDDEVLKTHPSISAESEYDSNEQESYLLRDLVCGFIIDTLVDYDQLTRGIRATNKSMIGMRSKLIKLLNHNIKSNHKLAKANFVDTVLSEWADCKVKSK